MIDNAYPLTDSVTTALAIATSGIAAAAGGAGARVVVRLRRLEHSDAVPSAGRWATRRPGRPHRVRIDPTMAASTATPQRATTSGGASRLG